MITSGERKIQTRTATTLVVIVAIKIEEASRDEILERGDSTMTIRRRQHQQQLVPREENDHRSYAISAKKKGILAQTAHNSLRYVIIVERKDISLEIAL